MSLLSDAINDAFYRAYPDPEPNRTLDEEILAKRVRMLIDDLECTRQNWHISEAAYVRENKLRRGLRRHWFQFWLPKYDPGIK